MASPLEQALADFVDDRFEDDEGDLVPVFAAYGHAMWSAQMVERSLITLVGLKALVATDGDLDHMNQVVACLHRRPMGTALNVLTQGFETKRATRKRAQAVVRRRNQLAHGFWLRHFRELTTSEGRERVLQLLDVEAEYFKSVIQYFQDIFVEVFRLMGVEPVEFTELMRSYLDGEIDEYGDPIEA